MWYVADFETTSYNTYLNTGNTRVWLWAVCNSDGVIVSNGSCIDTFIAWVHTIKGETIYFHNLKFDGSFIINYLLKNGFKYTKRIKYNSNKGFSTLIDDMGAWYNITINFKRKHQVKICDSLKVIPLKVKDIAKSFNMEIGKEIIDYEKYEINETTLSYIYKDVQIVAQGLKFFKDMGYDKMTIGSIAYNDFKESLKGFNDIFIDLGEEFLTTWRDAYRGGRCQVNERYANKILHNVHRFDINSMYPYVMAYCDLPYGKPIECLRTGKYKFELYEVDIDFTLKKGHQPSLLKKGSLFNKIDGTYYVNTDSIETIKISNIDLEILKRHYDIHFIKYKKIYGFKTSNKIFTKWILKNYELKNNNIGGLKMLYKLLINNLYGKYGSKCKGSKKEPRLEDNILKFTKGEVEKMRAYYLPVAIAVTSYAHRLIDDAIQLVGDAFVYCDTDSIHTLKVLPDYLIDNKELGKFKYEGLEDISKYVRQKCYIYKQDNKWSITCSGMNEEIKQHLIDTYGDNVINEFKIGLRVDDLKLAPKQVNGGVVLKPITFSLQG